MNMIKDVEITEEADAVTWALEKSGQYTVRSMYRMMAHRGVINYRMRTVWGCKLPMKLKIFLWQIMQDKLQTGTNLKKKKWKGNHKCTICDVPETSDHIFFTCILARFTWTCIKEAMGWDRVPIGLQDFLEKWVKRGSKNNNLVIYCFTIVLWSLWTTRNKFAIEGVFPSQPLEILIKINFWMQKWQVLLRGGDRSRLEDKIKMATSWWKNFMEGVKNQPVAESFL